MGGPIGRFLIRHLNFFAGPVMKYVTADRSKLDRATHRHYLKPLANPAKRKGSWVFPKHIIASSDWLDSLWSQREKIQNIPTLLLWGMSDPSFKVRELERFESIFSNFKTFRFDNVGHFVQEEKKEELVPLIEAFMAANFEYEEMVTAASEHTEANLEKYRRQQ
jgi:pimeloyl-ACP methyl ester carboxylesterase